MNSSSIQTSSNGLEVLIGTGQPHNEPFVGNRQDVLETRVNAVRWVCSSHQRPFVGAEVNC